LINWFSVSSIPYYFMDRSFVSNDDDFSVDSFPIVVISLTKDEGYVRFALVLSLILTFDRFARDRLASDRLVSDRLAAIRLVRIRLARIRLAQDSLAPCSRVYSRN